jgi:DNA mismatch endonuclease (patch repair protein)
MDLQHLTASRSKLMASIPNKDTKPELAVRRLIHGMGARFRLHQRHLPGRPDIVLPKRKSVVFVHGCFWHQHEKCMQGRLPQSRTDYWVPKLAKNVRRDAEAIAALRRAKWKVLVIWECETKKPVALQKRLAKFLDVGLKKRPRRSTSRLSNKKR